MPGNLKKNTHKNLTYFISLESCTYPRGKGQTNFCTSDESRAYPLANDPFTFLLSLARGALEKKKVSFFEFVPLFKNWDISHEVRTSGLS